MQVLLRPWHWFSPPNDVPLANAVVDQVQQQVRLRYKMTMLALRVSWLVPQRLLNYSYRNGQGFLVPATTAEAQLFRPELIAAFRANGQMHLADFQNPAVAEIMYTRGGFTVKDLSDEYKRANQPLDAVHKERLTHLADKLCQDHRITVLDLYDHNEGKQVTGALVKHFVEKQIFTIKDFIENKIVNVSNWHKLFSPVDLIVNPQYSIDMIRQSTPEEHKHDVLLNYMDKLLKRIDGTNGEEKNTLLDVAATLHRFKIIPFDKLIKHSPEGGVEENAHNDRIKELMVNLYERGKLEFADLIAEVIEILIAHRKAKAEDLIEHSWFNVKNWHHIFTPKQLAENPDYAKRLIQESHKTDKSRQSAIRHFAAHIGESLQNVEGAIRDELLGQAAILHHEKIVLFDKLLRHPSDTDPSIEEHNNQIYSVLKGLQSKGELVLHTLEDNVIVRFFKDGLIKLEDVLHLRKDNESKHKDVIKLALNGADPDAKVAMIDQLGANAATNNDVGFVIKRAVKNGWLELGNFAEEFKESVSKHLKIKKKPSTTEHHSHHHNSSSSSSSSSGKGAKAVLLNLFETPAGLSSASDH